VEGDGIYLGWRTSISRESPATAPSSSCPPVSPGHRESLDEAGPGTDAHLRPCNELNFQAMRVTLRDIHKHYGTLRANDGISMDVMAGSIHGVLGENGAGKSTLMKVLAGYVRKTRGTIIVDGRPVDYNGPKEATRLGIGMLYQDPLDFPSLPVLENYMMGQVRGFARNRAAFRKKLKDSAAHFGFNLDPDTPVESLSVGERQQLEILRLMAVGVRVLILDEPTTGISSLQREALFGALRKLAQDGKTVLFVSHKLEDVEALCDRVTVLRQGRVRGEMAHSFETGTILRWMFGSLPSPPPCSEVPPGSPAMVMEDVSVSLGRIGLYHCHVEIRQGEVIALAGLEGSGQGTFLRVAAGLIRPDRGSVRVGTRLMTGQDHHAFQAAGVNFIPAARLEEGLISGLTIAEHFALKYGKGIMIPWLFAKKQASEKIEHFRIVGTPQSSVESLSGGNQQRLLLALMPLDSKVLLLEHPTRGLDIESVNWVWQQLIARVNHGASIVFSTVELEEILQVADRVLVFFNGSVLKDVRTCDTTLEELGMLIAGKV